MAVDSKYGAVGEGIIPDHEPVFVLRAQDTNAYETIEKYLALCKIAGSPQRHLDEVQHVLDEIEQWQNANIDQVKVPD